MLCRGCLADLSVPSLQQWPLNLSTAKRGKWQLNWIQNWLCPFTASQENTVFTFINKDICSFTYWWAKTDFALHRPYVTIWLFFCLGWLLHLAWKAIMQTEVQVRREATRLLAHVWQWYLELLEGQLLVSFKNMLHIIQLTKTMVCDVKQSVPSNIMTAIVYSDFKRTLHKCYRASLKIIYQFL